MSIEKQKTLKYIPVANIAIFYFWLSCYNKYETKPFRLLKNILFCFVFIGIITLLRFFSIQVIESAVLQNLSLVLSVYLYFLSISFVGIKDQEKFLKENQ